MLPAHGEDEKVLYRFLTRMLEIINTLTPHLMIRFVIQRGSEMAFWCHHYFPFNKGPLDEVKVWFWAAVSSAQFWSAVGHLRCQLQ